MRRYLCVWFPNWALERHIRASSLSKCQTNPLRVRQRDSQTDLPFVLTDRTKAGLSVIASSPAAIALGVEPGLRFTDAKARVPSLLNAPADRLADQAALERLADWMVRWSPLVAVEGNDGLLLDITGCARVFGGEDKIVSGIAKALQKVGLTYRLGIADTLGAAWALAHTDMPRTIIPSGQTKVALEGLPVSGLRLSQEALLLLRRFGLNTIGQLYGIDRKSLSRRFRSRELADQTQLRLDQALGVRHEPISPLVPPADYYERLPCPEPLQHSEGIAAGLALLADCLCQKLADHGVGARRFILSAFRSDGTVSDVTVSLARAVRDKGHILRLFRDRIASVDPGFGIDLLILAARRVDTMGATARSLSAELAHGDTDLVGLSALADRICTRLGDKAVCIFVGEESHLPEKAEHLSAFEGQLPGWPACKKTDRPIFLFEVPERLQVIAEVPDGPPKRFVWRGVTRRVARADGPERIAPEWWRSFPAASSNDVGSDMKREWLTLKMDPRADVLQIMRTRRKLVRDLRKADIGEGWSRTPLHRMKEARVRDYYRIEEEGGYRFWVFREGLYGEEQANSPEWFIHGAFA